MKTFYDCYEEKYQKQENVSLIGNSRRISLTSAFDIDKKTA